MQLPTEKAPVLQRPVLLIHGYNSTAGAWVNMRKWFDTTNKDGGVVGPGTGAVDPQGKVFCAEFSRPYNGTKLNATELKQSIDRIVAATGAKQIDVVTHSMGGLDTRYYVDQSGNKIKNAVLIAPPNRGSELADIELKFRDMGIPIRPSVDDAEVRQCFHDLCVDKVYDGKDNNPVLHTMNQNWEKEHSAVNTMIIAGCGKMTLASNGWLTFHGDGAVPLASAQMDKVPVLKVWGQDHSNTKECPEALVATGNWLTGKKVDFLADQPDPPGTPPDRQIVPLQITSDSGILNVLVQDKASFDAAHAK
jgi:pimeloyl-ACP methyl ester carboxylesterase